MLWTVFGVCLTCSCVPLTNYCLLLSSCEQSDCSYSSWKSALSADSESKCPSQIASSLPLVLSQDSRMCCIMIRLGPAVPTIYVHGHQKHQYLPCERRTRNTKEPYRILTNRNATEICQDWTDKGVFDKFENLKMDQAEPNIGTARV